MGFYSTSQNIDIQVLDLVKQSPIPAVQIYFVETDQTVLTDSLGKFSIALFKHKQFNVRVHAAGFETGYFKIDSLSRNEKFYLTQKHLNIQEVTVTGTNIQARNKNPFNIETRKISELNGVVNVNLAEAITAIPGVYSASTGNGIAKPVIRGMQGMRLVSLFNGLRIEGQQWGGDHGMGVSELGIGTVEVIKGPASLLYGADALAGVIHYIDVPYAPMGMREMSVQNYFQSNTLGGAIRLLYKQTNSKIRWIAGASYTNHADYGLPNGMFAFNSRFSELVLKTGLAFNGKKSVHHVRYSGNLLKTGIPGHTHDSLASPESFQKPKPYRNFTLPIQYLNNHFLVFDNKWYLNKNELQLLFGHSFNRLLEYEEKVTIPGLSMALNNSSLNIKILNKSVKNLKWTSGMQTMFQMNRNTEKSTDTLIPNTNTLDLGAFTNFQYTLKKWNFSAGLRYDIRKLSTLDFFAGAPRIQKDFQGLNGAMGLVYSGKVMTYRFSGSTAYRAPHMTELLSNGFHHGAFRFEVGDQNLKSENAQQLDFTVEYGGEHFSLLVNPFLNQIRNYIYLQPKGSLFDGLPIFKYQQIDKILFYGTDIGWHYHPHFAHNLHLENTFSAIIVETNNDGSISLLPQPRFYSILKYAFNWGKRFQLKEFFFQHRFLGQQNTVAFNETPSKSYNVVDLSLHFLLDFKSEWDLSLGCKNIFNEAYIDHLSGLKNIGLQAPGRNFFVQLKYDFKSPIKSK